MRVLPPTYMLNVHEVLDKPRAGQKGDQIGLQLALTRGEHWGRRRVGGGGGVNHAGDSQVRGCGGGG